MDYFKIRTQMLKLSEKLHHKTITEAELNSLIPLKTPQRNTVCKCPKCKKNHRIPKMEWSGNGIPRKFCEACKKLLANIEFLDEQIIPVKHPYKNKDFVDYIEDLLYNSFIK